MNASNVHDICRYLTTREAASYMRVSKSYLDKQRLTGEGPRFIKAGSRVLYRIESLDGWMLDREIGSTSEVVTGLAA